jgi:hypothetical protein
MRYNFHFPYFHFKISFFTAVKSTFRICTGVLPDYFFLNSASTQKLREILLNCNVKRKRKKNVYNKQKIHFFFSSCCMKIITFHLVDCSPRNDQKVIKLGVKQDKYASNWKMCIQMIKASIFVLWFFSDCIFFIL